MAEQILKAMGGADSDGDGVPDRLLQLVNDSGFSLNADNWKNRRRIIYATAGSAWVACLLMVVVWCYMTLFTGKDIPPGLLNFGSSIFFSLNGFAVTIIIAYAGLSQADTNSYRKHSSEIAKTIPPPTNYGNFGYDRSQSNTSAPAAGYGYDVTATDSSTEDVTLPDTPTAPMNTSPNIGGPSGRKDVIL